MQDQADELRQLVQQVALSDSPPSKAPKLIAVTGAKGGVGTTTVAVNLAAVLAASGQRVVLVDADVNGPDAAELCHMPAASSEIGRRLSPDDFAHQSPLADVLAMRQSVCESLRTGPLGLELLLGGSPGQSVIDWTSAGQNRLIDQLMELGERADMVLLDVGNGLSRTTHRFWQVADEVILVTTAEDVAIMDAYATIKNFLGSASIAQPRIVVNRVVDLAAAHAAARRLSQACQRFLGRDLHVGCVIATDVEIVRAARDRCPLVAKTSQGPAARAFEQLAGQLQTDFRFDRPNQNPKRQRGTNQTSKHIYW